MVIKWTPLALEQLENFKKVSKMEIKNIKEYIISLAKYTENLILNNELGKVLFKIDSTEFRQVLYEKHRIIYYIKEDEIRIVSIIHTSQQLERAISILEKYYR